MKKIAIFLAALMLLAAVPFTAVAGPTGDITENAPVIMKNVAPTIDGVIGEDEGWSDPAILDYDHVGFSWRFQDLTMHANLYFAYDENGLYFAADVFEDSFLSSADEAGNPKDFIGNTFMLSDGFDDVTNDPSKTNNKRVKAMSTVGDYTITFDANGGLFVVRHDDSADEEYAKYTYKINETQSFRDVGSKTYPTPERSGYRFLGWYDGETRAPKETEVYGKTEDTTYTAMWEAVEPYPYGYNGDIVALTLDPHCALINTANLTGNSDHAPQYNIGLFDDGNGGIEAKVYLTYAQSRELTGEGSKVIAAGTVKTPETYEATTLRGDTIEAQKTGAQVEMFLPWEQIYEDVVYVSLLDEEELGFTAEDLAKAGSVMRAAVTYMDRYYDDAGEIVDNWGRWITVCYKTKNGQPGNGTSQVSVDSMGITLVNGFDVPFTDIGTMKYENKKADGTINTNVGEGKLVGSTWYTEAALWANENGLMNGTTATTFAPDAKMTRAQIALILAKLSGAELGDYKGAFADVKADHWAAKGIQWAVDNGVTGGTGTDKSGNKLFSPNAPLTRESLAVFFKAYAQNILKVEIKATGDLTPFDDAAKISTWAIDGMKWAVANNLISGTSATTISPQVTATRAQVAVIVRSFALNVVANVEN